MISRRSFNLSVASTALLTACGRGPAPEKADVVIIGGGISGLYSAMLLRQLGLTATVLEAQGEIGGRIKTVETEIGPLDVGASQVGRGYGRTISLCRKFNLELVPEDRDLLRFGMHFQGDWIDPATWPDDPRNLLVGAERSVNPMLLGSWISGQHNPLRNAQDWTDPRFADLDISMRALMQRQGYSQQAVELASSTIPGIGIDQTSMLRIWQEEKRGEVERSFSRPDLTERQAHPFGEINSRDGLNDLASISNIAGGCQALPNALAAELGDIVRVKKRVTAIDMSDHSGQVTCEDGSVFQGNFLISALPFSVLRSISIRAAPNPVQQQAINEMPYANTARLYLTINEPFWEKDGLPPSFSTDGPLGMFWAIDNSRAGGKHRAMIVLVGQAGMRISGEAHPVEFLLAELERLRPASRGLANVLFYKDWQADPFQKGCSFSMAPGQVNAFGRDMLKPWQVLHFAGEHARQAEYGMEAALESAERAAVEIMERVMA